MAHYLRLHRTTDALIKLVRYFATHRRGFRLQALAQHCGLSDGHLSTNILPPLLAQKLILHPSRYKWFMAKGVTPEQLARACKVTLPPPRVLAARRTRDDDLHVDGTLDLKAGAAPGRTQALTDVMTLADEKRDAQRFRKLLAVIGAERVKYLLGDE